MTGCSASQPSGPTTDAKVAAAINAGAWKRIGGEVPQGIESVESYVQRPEFDSTVRLRNDYVVVGTAYDDEEFGCRLYLHPQQSAQASGRTSTSKKQECFYTGYWDDHDVTVGTDLHESVPKTFDASTGQAREFFAADDEDSFYATPKAPVRVGAWVVYAGAHHTITFWNTSTGHGVFQRLGIEDRRKVRQVAF